MSSDLLLTTVSDFWKNHFKQYDAVKALVEGVFSSASDSYSKLSSAAVSRSIDSVVSTRSTKRRLLPVSRHTMLLKTGRDFQTNDLYLYYVMEAPRQLISISSIVSNVADDPTTRLILNEDFFIYRGNDFNFMGLFSEDNSWIKESSVYIVFRTNPLDTAGAQKSTLLVQDYYRLDVSSENSDWTGDLATGDDIILQSNLGASSPSRVLTIVDESKIILEPSHPATLECSRISYSDGASTLDVTPRLFTMESRTCYLVANDYVEDTEYLYTHFGYRYSTAVRPSDEHYRKILKAKALLSTAPPTKETLLSACNLFLGMPVFEAGSFVGEELLTSKTQSPSGNVKVTTNLGDYVVASGLSLRSDVSQALYIVDDVEQPDRQPLEFDKLEPLCSDIQVFVGASTDWWHEENLLPEIPLNVAPGLVEEFDREIIPGQHDNVVGSPDEWVIPEQRIGDYHFNIGDDTRRVLATALTEDFLKWKLVGIKFSPAAASLPTTFSVQADLIRSIQDSLPVGTLLLHNLV